MTSTPPSSPKRRVLRVGSYRFSPDRPAVIAPLQGTAMRHLLAEITDFGGHRVDIAEWRLDAYTGPDGTFDTLTSDAQWRRRLTDNVRDLSEALFDIPLMVTYRTRAQGGSGSIGEQDYLAVIEHLATLPGVRLVDIEVDHPRREEAQAAVQSAGKPVLVSHHDFDGCPDEAGLTDLIQRMRTTGADAVKVAVSPRDRDDVLGILAATAHAESLGGPILTIGMGAPGSVTRLVGHAFGSFASFGHLGRPSAPGQVHLDDLAGALMLPSLPPRGSV